MHIPDVENPCGFCKQKNSKVLYPTYDNFSNHFCINQCNNCRAYFLSPPPSEELLSLAYDESYYGEGEEKFNESLIEKMLDYFREKKADLINKHLKGTGKILDIGCGNGRFLSFVKARGNYKIFGIEIEGRSAERAAKIPGINLKTGTLDNDDFEPESMDAITLFHAFEHLDEPVKTLDIVSKVIKKGGLLVMSFPNIDSFQSMIFKGKWFHLDPPRHLFFITPKVFKQIMNNYGFELVNEKHFNIEYNPFGMQQSILNTILKKREVLYESLKGNNEYVKEYSKFNLLVQNIFVKLSAPLFIACDYVDSIFKKGSTVEFVFKKKTINKFYAG